QDEEETCGGKWQWHGQGRGRGKGPQHSEKEEEEEQQQQQKLGSPQGLDVREGARLRFRSSSCPATPPSLPSSSTSTSTPFPPSITLRGKRSLESVHPSPVQSSPKVSKPCRALQLHPHTATKGKGYGSLSSLASATPGHGCRTRSRKSRVGDLLHDRPAHWGSSKVSGSTQRSAGQGSRTRRTLGTSLSTSRGGGQGA
ncbi:unnamed protein product, partial [Discosporangium mesarthrocarpum]